MCPPLSIPSPIIASTPAFSNLRARFSEETTASVVMPFCLSFVIYLLEFPAPNTTTGTFSSISKSITSSMWGLSIITFTA